MAIFKCKMCGGTLEINNETVATCDYCGTQQTVPKSNDDVVSNLFNRANNLRLKCEFDKASQIYEKIVEQDDSEAEAHWGIVLCKYGIEYVEDPKTLKRIPTCHRTLFEAVTTDADYLAAVDYSDAAQQVIYENEARAIDKIQKDILSIVKNEKPFDVFICYKETDANGKRTIDSAIANDIYYQLTVEGFKVFYAAITLEDKLGQEYEPYIFAALNSSKVMLVLGTKPEYFSAVWVKNEWSRFMQLMKSDRSKLLIPCYRDMDAYELPEEFAHLQAQDMSKIGFINDVVRGIKKVGKAPEATVVKETVVTGGNTNTAPLLKRAFMFLEDGDFNSADEYCEKVLDLDPECAKAYLGKLMVELNAKSQEDLKNCVTPFDDMSNYQKTIRFADDKLKAELTGYIEHINTRNENARLDYSYNLAKNVMSNASTETDYKKAAALFEEIKGHLDSESLANECYEKAEIARKNEIYTIALNRMQGNTLIKNSSNTIKLAIKGFQSISGWRDADEKVLECERKFEEIKAKEEAEQLEKERQAELARIAAEKRAKLIKKIAVIVALVLAVVIAFVVVLNTVIIPKSKYNNAVNLAAQGDYANAALEFSALGNYKDSKEQAINCWSYITIRESVSGGLSHTVGLKSDGTVVAVGYNSFGQCNIESWKDIVAISAGYSHTVGLKSDGTVVAVGYNSLGQCNIKSWKDIVAISAGYSHTVGLKVDGTVVAVGDNGSVQCNVENWKDIIAISAGYGHTVGLKSDGTVVVVGYNNVGQCNVENWKDIIAISAGAHHTVGLKSDGTVVAVGYDNAGQCNVENWEDIIAISAEGEYTVGLKLDGTVVAVGYNNYGQFNVENWEDIIAISAGGYHTVGLKSDGTVVAVGKNYDGQCNVRNWKDIKTP